METLLQAIQEKIKPSTELIQSMQEYFECLSIKKKIFLLREEQYCQYFYFLKRGIARTFYIHKEKEVSSWFYHEGLFFSSWNSFYTQSPSYEYIETLEDCELYRISYTNYQKLVHQFSEFNHFARLLAEENMAFSDLYYKGYLFLSAQERFSLLKEYFPDIELRVQLGYIASFLGISQATLSRLRAKY